jgi:YHS domain-containing protein
MSELEKLEQRIEEKLAEQKKHAERRQNHLQTQMHAYDERQRRYTALADHLLQDVIRPRAERLVHRFDNAELLGAQESGRHSCVCRFRHTPRFPATATLELGLSHDGTWQNVWLLYTLSILPIFFQFNGQEQKSMRLDDIDEKQVAAWIEEKLLSFLDAYLRLESEDHYQTENMVIDPVCKMRVNRLYAAGQMKYKGRTYYFCVPECREKFVMDPEKYLGVASPA